MVTTPDYYEVLQVSPNAEGEVIQAAYKRLVDKWHFDRRPGDLSAFERLSLLDEASAVLSDAQKRQEYDLRKRQPAKSGAGKEEFPQPSDKAQQKLVSAAPRPSRIGPLSSATSQETRKSDLVSLAIYVVAAGFPIGLAVWAAGPWITATSLAEGSVKAACLALVLSLAGAVVRSLTKKSSQIPPGTQALGESDAPESLGECGQELAPFKPNTTRCPEVDNGETRRTSSPAPASEARAVPQTLGGNESPLAEVVYDLYDKCPAPQTPGDGETSNAAKSRGTVSTQAWVIVSIGIFLFLLAHGHELFAGTRGPQSFLVRCIGYGIFLGIPAYLCMRNKWRGGLTSVATLFILWAGLDAAVALNKRNALQPGGEVHPPRVEVPHLQAQGDLLDPRDLGPEPAAETHSRDAHDYIHSGLAWAQKQDFDKAIRDFDEAIRLQSDSSWAFSNRGKAWASRKGYDIAIQDFGEAIRLAPNDARNYFDRGNALVNNGDYQRAIKDYEEVIRLAPTYPDSYRRLSWLLATCPEVKIRDGERAIQVATTACELTDWKGGPELGALAAAYAEAGQFEEAVRYETLALEDPVYRGQGKDRFSRRLALYKAKQPDRARRLDAAEILPQRPFTPLTVDALYTRTTPAVVHVIAHDRQGHAIGGGSGFLVSRTGLIVTNYHVIGRAHKAHIVLADDTKVPVLGVAAHDEHADIAIIKVSGQADAQPLELAGDELPTVGARVYAIGNALGEATTLHDGLVSGHRYIDRLRMIQTTAPISPGLSGGPLIGTDGRVVGVSTVLSKVGQELNFAIPSSHVAGLLRRCEGGKQLTQLPLARQLVPDPKDSEQMLLGKWRLVKSAKGELPAGLMATIHFEKGNKVTMRVELAGKKKVSVGTWKLDGKMLTIEYTDGPPKGKKETKLVKTLTDEDLVTTGEKNATWEFSRIEGAK